jgi:hypothetical protein
VFGARVGARWIPPVALRTLNSLSRLETKNLDTNKIETNKIETITIQTSENNYLAVMKSMLASDAIDDGRHDHSDSMREEPVKYNSWPQSW